MAKKGKKRQEQAAANEPRDDVRRAFPGAAAVPEELPRHKEAPGDRAIDVLDNHTPDIDL